MAFFFCSLTGGGIGLRRAGAEEVLGVDDGGLAPPIAWLVVFCASPTAFTGFLAGTEDGVLAGVFAGVFAGVDVEGLEAGLDGALAGVDVVPDEAGFAGVGVAFLTGVAPAGFCADAAGVDFFTGVGADLAGVLLSP